MPILHNSNHTKSIHYKSGVTRVFTAQTLRFEKETNPIEITNYSVFIGINNKSPLIEYQYTNPFATNAPLEEFGFTKINNDPYTISKTHEAIHNLRRINLNNVSKIICHGYPFMGEGSIYVIGAAGIEIDFGDSFVEFNHASDPKYLFLYNSSNDYPAKIIISHAFYEVLKRAIPSKTEIVFND